MAGKTSDPRRRLKRRAAAVLALFAPLAAAEIALRLFMGGQEFAHLIELDPPSAARCLRLRPGAVVDYTGWGRRIPPVRQEVNSLGYRGPVRPRLKPAGTYRVAVLGDSFVYGLGVRAGRTIPASMERSLRAGSSVPIEVLNFGMPAAQLVNTAAQLEHFALEWSPDLVVYFLYRDDLDENPCRWRQGTRQLAALLFFKLRLSRLIHVFIVSRRARKTGEPDAPARASLLRKRLGVLRRLSRDRGTRLAVVILGDPVLPARASPHLEEVLDELKLPYLDARSWVLGPSPLPSIPNEGHFSGEGAEEAGARTAAWLKDSGLVPASR